MDDNNNGGKHKQPQFSFEQMKNEKRKSTIAKLIF